MIFGLISSRLAGYGALAAGGFYSWAANVYGYNRDAWMNDVGMRQNFAYQCDNMLVSAHEMSRDEVRDRSEAVITKISNYVLVTTLILGLAAEILVEGQIPVDSADFILNAYMLCLGTSVLYLVLSVLFGIVAINQIYAFSAELLTDKIPPAWKDIDEKTKRNMGENLSNQFEEKSWKHIFMPPLLRRLVRDVDTPAPETEETGDPSNRRMSDGATTQSCAAYYKTVDADKKHHSLSDIRKDYDSQWKAGEKNWLPLIDTSFECLAVGVKNLLDCYGYLCMAMLYSKYGDAWAFWACQMIFSSLNVLIMMFLFERHNHRWMPFVVNSGPLFCAFAATTPYEIVDRCCVPLCFISHFLMLTIFSSKIDAKACSAIPHEDPQDEFVVGQNDEEWDRGSQDDETTPRDDGYAPMFRKQAIEFQHHVDLVKHVSLSRLGSAEARLRKKADQLKSGSFGMRRSRSSGEIELGTVDGEQPQEASCCGRLEAFEDASSSADDVLAEQLHASARGFSGADYADILRNRNHTRLVLKRMMIFARGVLRTMWFCSVVWSLQKSIWGQGFSNDAAIWHTQLSGPPLAHMSVVETKWPSPYFTPHALACPKAEETFFADEYRVYRLSGTNQVEPYPCDVNGTIADISFFCNDLDCWPLVLLRELPPRILECSTGKEYPLLQTTQHVTQLAAVDARTILVAHNGEVVQYTWCKRRHAWAPYWTVAAFRETEDLQALDVIGERMLVFRRQGRNLEQGIVQVQNLKSRKQCGVWTMPDGILGAGCALRQGQILKALVRVDSADGPQVRLVQAELQEQGETSKSCEERVEDEEMPKAYKTVDAKLRGPVALRRKL